MRAVQCAPQFVPVVEHLHRVPGDQAWLASASGHDDDVSRAGVGDGDIERATSVGLDDDAGAARCEGPSATASLSTRGSSERGLSSVTTTTSA